MPEVPDGEVGAGLRGGDQVEGLEEKERTARIAGKLPHEGCGALVGEDPGNEEGFGGCEEPDETTVCCDLVLNQCLRLWGEE